MTTSQSDFIILRDLLNSAFSEGELRTLAFDLNIDYEDLAGANKAAKTRELISFVHRRDRLEDLIAYAAKARPNHYLLSQLSSDPDQAVSSTSLNIGDFGTTAIQGMGNVVGVGNVVPVEPNSFESLLEKKGEVQVKLNSLGQLITEATNEGMFSDRKSEVIAMENVQDVQEELSKENPRARWIELRLEDTRDILTLNASVSPKGEVSESVKDATRIAEELLSALREAIRD